MALAAENGHDAIIRTQALTKVYPGTALEAVDVIAHPALAKSPPAAPPCGRSCCAT